VKNLLELKNAQRVLIEGNLLEHNWGMGQVGFAVLFTVRNDGGQAPWAVVEDVTFANNVVRHAAGGVSIHGYDSINPTQWSQRILIRNNLFEDVDGKKWEGGWGAISAAAGAEGRGDRAQRGVRGRRGDRAGGSGAAVELRLPEQHRELRPVRDLRGWQGVGAPRHQLLPARQRDRRTCSSPIPGRRRSTPRTTRS
jgi:hypothetical protein